MTDKTKKKHMKPVKIEISPWLWTWAQGQFQVGNPAGEMRMLLEEQLNPNRIHKLRIDDDK